MDRVLYASGAEATFSLADDTTMPLVFLAGPDADEGDWKAAVSKHFLELCPELLVAVPRPPALSAAMPWGENNAPSLIGHMRWRRLHLFHASQYGVILFYFPRTAKQPFTDPSFFELGEWLALHNYRGVRVVVCIERGSAIEEYVRQRIYSDFRDVTVTGDLRKACEECVELIRHAQTAG